MMQRLLLSVEDVAKLKSVYKKLAQLPNTEASFIQIESLFYDLLAIARNYEGTSLASGLREVQITLYKRAQEKTLTAKMKVTAKAVQERN